jgi:hypothetical protein
LRDIFRGAEISRLRYSVRNPGCELLMFGGCPELCPFDRQGLENVVLSIFELHRADVYTRTIPPVSLVFTLGYASTSLGLFAITSCRREMPGKFVRRRDRGINDWDRRSLPKVSLLPR